MKFTVFRFENNNTQATYTDNTLKLFQQKVLSCISSISQLYLGLLYCNVKLCNSIGVETTIYCTTSVID